MKISRVRAIPYRVPLRSTMNSALGAMSQSEYGLVRLETDDGLEGLGEISLIWHGDGASLCDLVNEVVGPAVVGFDLFDYSRIMAAVHASLKFGRHSLTAAAAVDMAVLDAQGKYLGQPVMNLLGGAAADRILLTMSLSIASPEEAVAEAHGYRESGFRVVKVKAGRDHDRTVATVKALNAEFGSDLGVRVDLNMACVTAKEALGTIRRLEEFGVLSVEQPLAPDDLAGLAFLRQHTVLPIMVDESVWGPVDAREVILAGAADIINIYVAESGGIRPAKLIADLAELNHIGVAIGSMPETGVGTAAAAHLGFSMPKLEHPSDVAGVLYHADDVVVSNLVFDGGYIYPPTAPGLGVAIDEEKLSAFAIRR
jgi:L-alanine-DL-glutamate epimerase-like enolase superfamily enzyme